MLFNSYEFLFAFLPLVVLGLRLVNSINKNFTVQFLAFFSLIFYSWDSLEALPILIISITINYLIVSYLIKINRNDNLREFLFYFGIFFNIFLICIYKYNNLIIDFINLISSFINISKYNHVSIFLPTGISFYTFTQIALLIDSYKKEVERKNFGEYLLFVTFFPHLIAGPLLFHKKIFFQFKSISVNSLKSKYIALGIIVFTIGLVKKVLLADNISFYVDSIYKTVENGTLPMIFIAWIAMIGYTLQLYFDFSGYSDMAIGLALICGIKIPENFNSPYKSKSIIEFWQKWHISLSNFLRDYLYIPLGGNRKGEFKKYKYIFITMTLGGLWHGANYTFIIWGMLHSLLIIFNHLIRKNSLFDINFNLVKCLSTFLLINITWIFFRSPDLDIALKLLNGILGFNGISVPEFIYQHNIFQNYFNVVKPLGIWQGVNSGMGLNNTLEIISLITFSLVIVFFMPNTNQITEQIESFILSQKNSFKLRLLGICIIIFLWICIMNFSKPSPFLYFRF